MAALNYPVAGPPRASPVPTDGSVPIRRELRDLQRNFPDQFTLYILGLDALQKRDARNDLSYYGIAGIHGRPYKSWGGSRQNNPGGWQGYCTHSSILFAPWHRPYLALFEQNLYEEVQRAARSFPPETRARYQQAAVNFRAPYWDWAANPPAGETFFPIAASTPNISVITPQSNGQRVSIRNPLYSHRFTPLNPFGNDFANLRGTPYDQWPETLRYPSSTTSVRATSTPELLERAAATQIPSLQGDVFLLLNDPSYKSLEAFSSNAWRPPARRSQTSTLGSVEDLHGSIHYAVGGSMGHMSQLQYSAFDPIFWLHHGNIDRLFAIWQATNPRAYGINRVETEGTFSIRGGTPVTQDTPLPPFNDASGSKYWTSATARNTEAFNYAYPETRRWRYATDAEYIDSVEEAVFQLYGGVSRIFRRPTRPSQFDSEDSEAPVTTSAVASAQKPEEKIVSESTVPVATAQKPQDNTNQIPAPKPASQNPLQEDAKPVVTASKPIEATKPAEATKPVPTTSKPAAKEHHGGFFHDLGHRIKEAITGDDAEKPKDGVRGLDLESEIGKPGGEPEPKDTSYIEYVCTLKGPKHILQQTYIVHVFLGEFNPDTQTWCVQNALVGTFTVFGKALTTGCEKCAEDAENELEVSGTVNLTAALIKELEDGHLGSLERENVIPWLRKNLHWRVTLADGTEKAREEVPHLKVGVVSTVVELPVGKRPVFSGEYIVHTEVTEGRPAGLKASPTTGPPAVAVEA